MPTVLIANQYKKVANKPPKYQAAFTLLELIISVVIIAILASYIQTRFVSSAGFMEDTVIEQIISAGQLTQQLSMNDSTRSFSLSIEPHQINLLADGITFSSGLMNFPLTFSSKVTLSPVTSIVYSSLGETLGTTINVLADESMNVCFEASGYIHRC